MCSRRGFERVRAAGEGLKSGCDAFGTHVDRGPQVGEARRSQSQVPVVGGGNG